MRLLSYLYSVLFDFSITFQNRYSMFIFVYVSFFFLADEYEAEDEISQNSSYRKKIMPGLCSAHDNPVMFH